MLDKFDGNSAAPTNYVTGSAMNVLFLGDSTTAGFYADAGHKWRELIMTRLAAMYPDYVWGSTIGNSETGYGGWGSIVLNPNYGSTDQSNVPAREWLTASDAVMAVLNFGYNNIALADINPAWPDQYDQSTRYSGTKRGYHTTAEAMTWWVTDVTAGVRHLHDVLGIPFHHILIMGQAPCGSADPFDGRGGRYSGGNWETQWRDWNRLMRVTAESLGCVFVPMEDVYGPAYQPSLNILTANAVALDAINTTVTVLDTTGVETGDMIKDRASWEVNYVTAVPNGTQLTVIRAFNGDHTNGTTHLASCIYDLQKRPSVPAAGEMNGVAWVGPDPRAYIYRGDDSWVHLTNRGAGAWFERVSQYLPKFPAPVDTLAHV